MLIAENPKNETKEHYELKQIAKYILFSRGYKNIATEVYGCQGKDNFDIKGCYDKDIIDVVGIKTTAWYNAEIPDFKIMGIEAKASLSDFKNGFCTGCDLTYVIAPKGIIPIKLLPKGIGLIEVDLENYKIIPDYQGIEFKNILFTKRASKRICNRFKNEQPYDKYADWRLNLFRQISYRSTVENLYDNPNIKLNKKIFNEETFEWDIV